MSSFSHSTYLRKWANKTGVPIISIDYRLAPESKYPEGLDDCWQAYYWIINHAEQMIGISPKKIILVGDSAGGNFVVGVTLRAIQTGFKKPDGIILAYPALCLSLKTFNPSHLISLDDLLLPYSFLKICLELYVGQQGQPDFDPYLSPLYIEDKYLEQFPTTRIMIAGKDPLRDDSFKFALKLLKLGVDVHVKQFRTFPHGFLSYDMPFGIKECKRGVEQGTKWIKQLFEISEFDDQNNKGDHDANIESRKQSWQSDANKS